MTEENKPGFVIIHGVEYETVASRLKRFREEYKDKLGIATEIISNTESSVSMKASIVKYPTIESTQQVLATGHAEEKRGKGVNVLSALENCETSAVGRALAMFGYHGTDIASAEEMKSEQRKAESEIPGGRGDILPFDDPDPDEVKARELGAEAVDENGDRKYTPAQIGRAIAKAKNEGTMKKLIEKFEGEQP